MAEKPEQKAESRPGGRRNSLTIGIGNQETANRFLNFKNGTYASTYEEALKLLLDAHERPNTDNSGTIANLQQRIKNLEEDSIKYQEHINERDRTIKDLQDKLDAAINDANTNDELSLGNQLQLEELQHRTAGAIVLSPNPVVAHFLKEMAAKTGSTPARILEELYLADLQNPTVNNLPYTVSSGEIRKVMKELQKEEAGE